MHLIHTGNCEAGTHGDMLIVPSRTPDTQIVLDSFQLGLIGFWIAALHW